MSLRVEQQDDEHTPLLYNPSEGIAKYSSEDSDDVLVVSVSAIDTEAGPDTTQKTLSQEAHPSRANSRKLVRNSLYTILALCLLVLLVKGFIDSDDVDVSRILVCTDEYPEKLNYIFGWYEV